jgi:hypothetical protein
MPYVGDFLSKLHSKSWPIIMVNEHITNWCSNMAWDKNGNMVRHESSNIYMYNTKCTQNVITHEYVDYFNACYNPSYKQPIH